MSSEDIKNFINEDSNNIKIPIKGILESCMSAHDCDYPLEATYLIRRFAISGLNLGYYKPENLVEIMDKFCSRIKAIKFDYEIGADNEITHYSIKGNTLHLCEDLEAFDDYLYTTAAFSAFFEAISSACDYHEHEIVKTALSYMVGEKFLNMDINDSRIIMPKTTEIELGAENNKQKLQLRAGYLPCWNLSITLLKQYFISIGENENILFRDAILNNFEDVMQRIEKRNNQAKILFSTIETIYKLHVSRHEIDELKMIDKYQMLVNSIFKRIDQNYFAFCALITTDDCRQKLMKLKESELEE